MHITSTFSLRLCGKIKRLYGMEHSRDFLNIMKDEFMQSPSDSKFSE